MINHNSITEIRTLLESEGLTLKKRFGQNFLTDAGMRARIADAVAAEVAAGDPSGERELWEIGPGIGSLTALLVPLGRPLRVSEVDHGLIRVLRREFGSSVTVEEGEFVRTAARVAGSLSGDGPAAIVGNLPYYSASAMVAAIIDAGIAPPAMVFLVQAELADRFAAVAGGKDYSALSVLVQSHYRVERLFSIPGGAFYPRPRVGSTVVALRRRASRPDARLTASTSEIARRAFSQRRKTLRNTLRDLVDVLEELGIDPGLRPEQLSPEQFRDIATARQRRGLS